MGFFVIFYFGKSSWTGFRLVCHFPFRKISEYEHWAFLLFSILKKLYRTSIWPLYHFGCRKNSEYVHWAFSSFYIFENHHERAFGYYAILGLEKYPSMRIGLFDCFLF